MGLCSRLAPWATTGNPRPCGPGKFWLWHPKCHFSTLFVAWLLRQQAVLITITVRDTLGGAGREEGWGGGKSR